ncbi:DUF5711 family protein [Paenibacillus sp. HJGM_3]|uniref:DUF5711 family protein n=1 Tax=Paenibacillus sp. HJGM_3 TaxID=3379816 RepID=UPI00385D5FD1
MKTRIVYLMLAVSLLFFAHPAMAEPLWQMDKQMNVNSLSIATDGERIAVGTQDAAAFVLKPDGTQVYRFEAKNVITGVSMLDTGELLVSSDDQYVYLLDVEGKPVWSKSMKKMVKSISSTPDGEVIAVTLFRSNAVHLLNKQGEVVKEIPVGIDITGAQVSPNGKFLAAAGADQFLYVYNGQGELVVKTSISGSINSVSISDEGVAVVGSSEDKVIILDAGGKKLTELLAGDIITSVHITGDADYVAYADYSGQYYVGSLKGQELWSAQETGAGRQIRFSPDGKHLYAASDKGAVYQYEVGHLLKSGQQAALRQKTIQYGSIAAVALLILVLILWTVKRKPEIFKRLWKDKYAYMMLVPSFSLLLVFLYYPSISGLFHSLYDWNPGSRSTFVGLDNFKRMLDDPYVSKGAVNLLILVVTGLFKTLIPPLIVAELIYHLRNNKAKYLFRTSFVISMVIPSVGFLLVWQNLYDPNIGLINQILTVIGLDSFAHPWLGDADTALWAIIFMGFPFVGIMQLLVMYSGLIAISDEVIEAARMDGAKSFRIIRSIHLPLLGGQFKLLIVLALIGIVQDFGSILIVTGGGPMDSTYVPALQMYYAATKFGDLGYASALGVSMFLVILLITVINMKFIKTAD